MNDTPANQSPESTVPDWKRPIPAEEVQERLGQQVELADWRHRLFGIYTAYRCPSSAAAVELLGRIAAVAEELDHHPDVDWRYEHVFITSCSHDAQGAVTMRDLRLAGRISQIAQELGVTAVPEQNTLYDIAVDTRDDSALEPFWTAALGYEKDERTGDLRDPHRRGPGFWFQTTDTPQERALHVDVTGPSSGIQDMRGALAPLAAGDGEDGTFAPRWWIYTDADGNRVCLCTGEITRTDPDA